MKTEEEEEAVAAADEEEEEEEYKCKAANKWRFRSNVGSVRDSRQPIPVGGASRGNGGLLLELSARVCCRPAS